MKASSTPIPQAPGVYAISMYGSIVYIGSTQNLRARALEHGIGRRWQARKGRYAASPDSAFRFSIDTKPGRWLMREYRLIRRLRPLHNSSYAGGRRRP